MIDRRFCCPNCGAVLLPENMRDRGLTRRQKDTLAFIIGYIAQHGFAPLLSEIAAGIGVRQKSGVVRLIRALEVRGLITTERQRQRSIEVTPAGAAVLPAGVKETADAT